MSIGVTIGYAIAGVFLLALLGIFGFTLYVFFKKFKVFLNVNNKKNQTITPEKKDEKKDVKVRFCSKCGSQVKEKDSFCNKCGGHLT